MKRTNRKKGECGKLVLDTIALFGEASDRQIAAYTNISISYVRGMIRQLLHRKKIQVAWRKLNKCAYTNIYELAEDTK